MSLRERIILAGMIIKGVATFGLMAYTMVNFAIWMIENNQKIEKALSEETIEIHIE